MPSRLDSTTDCAGITVVFDKVSHAGPDIITADQLDRLVLAVVACKGVIVLTAKYSESKIIVVWDVGSLVEEEHAI